MSRGGRRRRTSDYPGPFLESVGVEGERIVARFADGRIVSVPLAWSWRLEAASPEERARVEVGVMGARWPDVDEDLSAQGFLTGTPAPRPAPERMRAILDEARAEARAARRV